MLLKSKMGGDLAAIIDSGGRSEQRLAATSSRQRCGRLRLAPRNALREPASPGYGKRTYGPPFPIDLLIAAALTNAFGVPGLPGRLTVLALSPLVLTEKLLISQSVVKPPSPSENGNPLVQRARGAMRQPPIKRSVSLPLWEAKGWP